LISDGRGVAETGGPTPQTVEVGSSHCSSCRSSLAFATASTPCSCRVFASSAFQRKDLIGLQQAQLNMVVENTGIDMGGKYSFSAYACCYRTVCAEIQYVGYLESCAGCEYCESHEIHEMESRWRISRECRCNGVDPTSSRAVTSALRISQLSFS
jgi:hypothetical protein